MQFLIGLFLMILSVNAMASPDHPIAGQDYAVLDAPLSRIGTGKNKEVIQFFMFQCRHCYSVEPLIEKWALQNKDQVDLVQVHFSKGLEDNESRLFLTLEAMGILDQMKPKVFEAIHVEKYKFSEERAVLEWMSKQSLEFARFDREWNSRTISERLTKNAELVARFGVRSVPAFVVDGRYLVSPSILAKSYRHFGEDDIKLAMVKVLSHLVKSSRE